MKHLRYLKYLIVHKWFVMLACFRYGLYWQGIIHDWSKFLPSEWFPYVESFYGRGNELRKRWRAGESLDVVEVQESAAFNAAFDQAWLLHQHRNPHHWQHWVLKEDSGDTKYLAMPEKYRLEMLADWEGAGRAITGKSGDSPVWYAKNRINICLHPETFRRVDAAMGYVPKMPPLGFFAKLR